jgi:GNAT superfamily N-acetyltransferase
MDLGDVDAAYGLATAAFAEPGEAERRTDEQVVSRKERFHRALRHDPEGAWVAEDEGGRVAGVAVALLREGLWVLSLFVVGEGYRGRGIGAGLMERALRYGAPFESGMIASSTHPAAMRSYALAGFDLHPTFTAKGAVRREALPSGLKVREGGADDLELAAEVDRHLRGAAHGPDLEYAVASGNRLRVAERGTGSARGYALTREDSPYMVAATEPGVASDLLWATLAESDGEKGVEVRWITGSQSWAVQTVLAAGLNLQPDGPICVKGSPGPLWPYLPSGAYL